MGVDSRRRRRRWPWVLGLVAAPLYSNFLIAWLLQGFGDTARGVSRLEVPGQPDATVLRLTDIASALLVLPLLVRLPAALPPRARSWPATSTTGARSSRTWQHSSPSVTWASTRRRGPRWLARTSWWLFWVGGVVTVVLLGYADLRGPALLLGVAQRVHIVCLSVWICCVGLVAAGRCPDRAL